MRPDVEKLLGGWAAGTLTAEERRALMQAALEDQELFDQLAAEQPLKEALEDPAVRSRIRAATEPRRRLFAWHWGWSAAASVAVVSVLTFAVCRWEFGLGTRKAVDEAEIASEVAKEPAAAVAPAEKRAEETASAEPAAAAERREAVDSGAAASKGNVVASVPGRISDKRERAAPVALPPASVQASAAAVQPPPELKPRQAFQVPEPAADAAQSAGAARGLPGAEPTRAPGPPVQRPSAPIAEARMKAAAPPPPAAPPPARAADVQSQLARQTMETAAPRRSEESGMAKLEAKSSEGHVAEEPREQAETVAATRRRDVLAPVVGFAATPGAVPSRPAALRAKAFAVPYRIERRSADGTYTAADPATAFARTDALRLVFSVPAKAVVSVSAGQTVLWSGTAPAGQEQSVVIPAGTKRLTIRATPETAAASASTRPAVTQIDLKYE